MKTVFLIRPDRWYIQDNDGMCTRYFITCVAFTVVWFSVTDSSLPSNSQVNFKGNMIKVSCK
jgi:hypothetical protein